MSDRDSAAVGPLLDEIFRGAPGLRESEANDPDDQALVAYLSGALAPDEAARVEKSLVRRPAARRRLHAVAERLDSLQASPWSVLETAGDGVGRAWHALASSRLAEVPVARGRWAAAGWEAVRAQAAAGVAEAQAAWAAFRSFAEQWERTRRMPRLAEARGGGPVSALDSFPPGVVVTLEADVTPDGSLAARAWLRDSGGGPSAAMDGRTARLGLAAGADVWPLAGAVVRDGAAAWNLKGAGWELGLSPGPVPASDLTVSFDSSPVLLPPDTVRVLLARDGGGGDNPVRLLGTARRGAERLRLSLALDAPIRVTHAQDRLTVSVLVAPGLRQRLGAWPVAEWGETARTVEMRCPGPDGDFDPAALSLGLIE